MGKGVKEVVGVTQFWQKRKTENSQELLAYEEEGRSLETGSAFGAIESEIMEVPLAHVLVTSLCIAFMESLNEHMS